MRSALLLLFGIAALAAAPTSSYAATLGAARVEAAPSANIVEVDRRCGRGAHFVPRHRARNGRIIHGHCVRDRRR